MKHVSHPREYKIRLFKKLYPPYWDEGDRPYPNYRRGYKNPNKFIYTFQVRRYKTWKYNRKTQWKE